MRKFKLILITGTLILSTLTVLAAAENQTAIPTASSHLVAAQTTGSSNEDSISLTMDGKAITLEQSPELKNGEILVPVRSLCKSLGARVQWEPSTRSILIQRRDHYISLTLNDSAMETENGTSTLDVPPEILNGCSYVPLNPLAKAMEVTVKWVPASQSVLLTTPQGDHYITDQWNTYTVCDQPTGATLYQENTVYPVLAHDKQDAAITRINQTMKGVMDSIIQKNESDLIQNAQDILKSGGHAYNTSFTSLTTEMTVPYDQNNRLSVRFIVSADFGGAHPSNYMESYNFNTTDGSELNLSDVLNCTDQEALQKVRDAYLKDIAANPDHYFDDAKTTATKLTNDDFAWVLSKNGVKAYVQNYTLAPYAGGFPSVTIPCNS